MPRRPSRRPIVRDASTGEPVAAVTTEGLDLARRPRLRPDGRAGVARRADLPPARRAAEADGAACSPSARTSSTRSRRRTGATKNDSWVDIDGGIGVLFTYSSKGRRELPNAKVYVDGAGRGALEGRQLHRPAHLHPADRRRGADQRVQLPGLGVAREVRARVPRRHADAREAGDAIRIPRRGDGAHPRRVGAAARRIAAARLGQRSRRSSITCASATWSRSPGRRRRPSACASHDVGADRRRRVLERDRLDQRVGAGPGCRGRHPRVRRVRRAS